MNHVNMKAYKATEISFINNVEGNTKLELENKYSYNVKYSPSQICRGEFTATVTDKHSPDKFNIKVVVVGVFSFNTEIEKEFLHVETFNQLFPYVRSLITTITANAGIPPILIPATDIEGQSIYRFEKNV